MGVGYSNSLKHFQTEVDSKFLRHLESSVYSQQLISDRPFEERARRVLFTYPSLLLINFMDGMTIDLGHLAVLFVLDGDRDGLFSWRDIEGFIEWVHDSVPTDEKDLGNDFSEAVHARCVLKMWRECTGIRGFVSDAVTDGAQSDALSQRLDQPLRSSARLESSTNLTTQSQSFFNGMFDTSATAGAVNDLEIFEEWFERFLSKNFPFHGDRLNQQAPVGVVSGESTDDIRLKAERALDSYTNIVVDAAGPDSIAICEMGPSELRRPPRAFSLDAIASAHVLLGVEENYGMDLRSFCSLLVGEENMKLQGREFSCPGRALRAFNTAFVDSYWAALRRFGLQPLL